MAHSRRDFLQTAALALGASGAVALPGGAQPPSLPAQAGKPPAAGAAAPLPAPPRPVSTIQVPKMPFGTVEISRMIVGCNPFYGFAHFNSILATVMREYYTPERVCDVLHQCARFGINAYNYVQLGRAPQDLERFRAEGGAMHLIIQGIGDPAPLAAQWRPLAIYHHGERTDAAFRDGKIATVRDWCRQARDAGVMVGVGTHRPEVIALVEDQGWDVDFYAGCVYNRSRTPDEWKTVLNGELLEMPGEIYVQSDPARMYAVMRQVKKPCFAFKIMAAGRITDKGADQAFQTAFDSLKPTDGIFVGMFPRVKDEIRENVERVHRILTSRPASSTVI
ncbi:MAG: twin-arginine translocation signal domain-containing protein [Acidobacteria bacterium]|jgi:hypothetical protein|nr:twin-arginine translocation signal domain-containing protein [Acidobacteriota bacterium]